jgi:hypothetical protein
LSNTPTQQTVLESRASQRFKCNTLHLSLTRTTDSTQPVTRMED